MNQYVLESVLLALFYRPLGMILLKSTYVLCFSVSETSLKRIIVILGSHKNYETYNRSERKQVFTSNNKFCLGQIASNKTQIANKSDKMIAL